MSCVDLLRDCTKALFLITLLPLISAAIQGSCLKQQFCAFPHWWLALHHSFWSLVFGILLCGRAVLVPGLFSRLFTCVSMDSHWGICGCNTAVFILLLRLFQLGPLGAPAGPLLCPFGLLPRDLCYFSASSVLAPQVLWAYFVFSLPQP